MVADRLARKITSALNFQIEELRRKVARLEAVERGEAKIIKVWRRGYTVREHKVRGHHMNIVVGATKQPTRKLRSV